MTFTLNAVHAASRLPSSPKNDAIFQWVVRHVVATTAPAIQWHRVLDVLVASGRLLALRWLVRASAPHRLDFELYWDPNTALEKAAAREYVQIVRWLCIFDARSHAEEADTLYQNVDFAALHADSIKLSLYIAISRGNDCIVLDLLDRFPNDLDAGDALLRCAQKRQKSLARKIWQRMDDDGRSAVRTCLPERRRMKAGRLMNYLQ